MTPTKNHCIPEQFIFEQVESCPVVVNFNGEPVTSDAGLTLIAELDRKREITSRLAACFKDYREQNKVLHPINSLIAQRIYGLIMGYEDINDHETLRHDPIFALFFGKVVNSELQSITLAGKSTLNRLEHCPENISSKADSRYHRIEHDTECIEKLLVELFLGSPLVKYHQENFILKNIVSPVGGVGFRPVELANPKGPRGNMENRLKEQKLGVKSDRTSTHTFEGNQLRLWFASIAYILINALREQCLVNTEFKNATVETIRTKLLKLGAIITIRKRRVLIAISSACPYKDIFRKIYRRLSRLPCPG